MNKNNETKSVEQNMTTKSALETDVDIRSETQMDESFVEENGKLGYEFYRNVLGAPKYVLAPMVDQSELPFRELSRELGAQLCYTPMWHAGIFSKDEKYRKAALETCPTDRPLIYQFCANDPEKFASACELAEPHCDGVDLNLGCPQVIAQRGHYGAFLMQEWDRVESIIKTASQRIKKPVTCKIRVFESIEMTVEYAKRLERAGAKIITVHGRRREQKGPLTGLANWDHIKAVKENVRVPVFANGNIQYMSDVMKCLEYTKVDAVMTAEGALYNPALFTGRQPAAWEMADKYLEYVGKFPTQLSFIRGHLFRIYHHCLCKYPELRHPLGVAKKFEVLISVVEKLKEKCKSDAEKDIIEGLDSEEPGKLPYWRCQPYVRPPPQAQKRGLDHTHLKPPSKRKALMKKKYEHGKGVFPKVPRDKWPLCKTCTVNPWGKKCVYNLCKKCCRADCLAKVLDCSGHRFYYLSNSLHPRTPPCGKKNTNLDENEKTDSANIKEKDIDREKQSLNQEKETVNSEPL